MHVAVRCRAQPAKRGGGEEADELELRGWDVSQAARQVDEMTRRMATVAGVADVRVSRRGGSRRRTWFTTATGSRSWG